MLKTFYKILIIFLLYIAFSVLLSVLRFVLPLEEKICHSITFIAQLALTIILFITAPIFTISFFVFVYSCYLCVYLYTLIKDKWIDKNK